MLSLYLADPIFFYKGACKRLKLKVATSNLYPSYSVQSLGCYRCAAESHKDCSFASISLAMTYCGKYHFLISLTL